MNKKFAIIRTYPRFAKDSFSSLNLLGIKLSISLLCFVSLFQQMKNASSPNPWTHCLLEFGHRSKGLAQLIHHFGVGVVKMHLSIFTQMAIKTIGKQWLVDQL